jgi:hypothetical protein
MHQDTLITTQFTTPQPSTGVQVTTAGTARTLTQALLCPSGGETKQQFKAGLAHLMGTQTVSATQAKLLGGYRRREAPPAAATRNGCASTTQPPTPD